MSGFVVVYDRSGAAIDPAILERVMNRLTHRGPDGRNTYISGTLAMGHWHFWTTPEEVGEKQPLALPEMPFRIVLDGRLDNRSELFSELGLDTEQSPQISDAALVLRSYERWREHCFEHFVGEFVVVIFDGRNRQLVCARDHLGDRTLFFAFHGTRLVIASEPWAVAGADDLKPEISEKAVAYYFALRAPEDGQSMFEGVFELLPAHVMIINESGDRKWRYWKPDPTRKIRYKTDEEYAEHFLSLLEESVRCRMRSTTPVGVLMSGGLDSTSVACLAARMIAPEQLTTISYVFDELTDCDERVYINAVREKWNTESIQIRCDDLWPYKDWSFWPRNPNHPELNPYRLLKERALENAHQSGINIMLTGGFGDHLYDGVEEWMIDLIHEGKKFNALQGMIENIRYFGFQHAFKARSLQRAIKYTINCFLGNCFSLGSKNAKIAHLWLTALSKHYLRFDSMWLTSACFSKANLLGLEAAQSCTVEIFNASRHAVELRNPYRDRRLIEFMITIPAYQLYAHGLYKYILRNALKGILPEIIRTRSHATSFLSLYLLGLQREKHLLWGFLQDGNAGWRRFIRAEWLLQQWNAEVRPEKDGPELVVPWLSFSYETW